MFEIIVDSAANIPAELCKKFKIKVLSFVNLVNGKEMTCFEPDLTPEQERAKGKEYYDAIREGAEVRPDLSAAESLRIPSGKSLRPTRMYCISPSAKT